ncbi:MAG: hypothetical protein COV75_08250 [Candidatus Omnitrophica bacterium CG11_big_fil_rev_8_21_14_0_20_63_9]|nr:MAG: hypothetical protein COV75_08250 [Candidatus Omnitrophica bacterium CG11_big_fil_rev_8_21_14_0_20_63_9]
MAGAAFYAAIGFVWAPLARAEVPNLINYQGQATDTNGVPLEGPYTLTFRLYDAETAGNEVWEEQQMNVQLTGGHFSVLLGSKTPMNGLDWSAPCWLSVQVNGESELAPRQRITSVPLAVRAKMAEQLTVPITTSNITDDSNRLVPTGAIILWEGASCPTGYTRLSSYDDKFLLASGTAGTSGGSNTHNHSGSTGSHSLSINEIPSHSHSINRTNNNGGAGSLNGCVGAQNFTDSISTASAGGGAGHSHTIGSADNRPAFKTILMCKKN